MFRKFAVALALACIPATIGCKRAPVKSAPDAAAATAGSVALVNAAPSDVVWDGVFGAARTPAGAIVVAIASAKSPWLRVVELDASGAETKPARTLAVSAPLASAPSLATFSDGSVALIASERLGDPAAAKMIALAHTPAARSPTDATVIGADWCNTEDSLYFIDRTSHQLRRWAMGEPEPRVAASDAPSFVAHAAPLCGTHAAFVLEPRENGFDVVVASGFVRTRVAAGVDPSSGGTSEVYVTGDAMGIVAVLAQGGLSWTTVSSDGKATVHPITRKLKPEQTPVAVDGTESTVAVLLQRDGHKQCGEDEAPPYYDVLEFGSRLRPDGELSTLPPLECDSESSPPDLQQTKSGIVVRWFEWKENGADKRLRFWTRGGGASDGGSGLRLVPTDTSLLDCGGAGERCLAVGRSAGKFRVATTP